MPADVTNTIVLYCIKLKRAASQGEREAIENEMRRRPDLADLLAQLSGQAPKAERAARRTASKYV